MKRMCIYQVDLAGVEDVAEMKKLSDKQLGVATVNNYELLGRRQKELMKS